MKLFIDLVKNGAALYITLMLAIMGYMFQAKLPEQVNGTIITAIMHISCIVIAILVACGYGIFMGAAQIRNTLSCFDNKSYTALGIDRYFRRAFIVTGVTAAACIIIVLSLMLELVHSNRAFFLLPLKLRNWYALGNV